MGLSLGLGLITALLARLVHGRRSELDGRGGRPAPIEPVIVVAPPAEAEPVADVDDHVVIDLTDGALWTTPVDGECPDGFPIKAKLSSGIFHLPGMSAYGRTHPDRCYASADDALLDGLRAAKR